VTVAPATTVVRRIPSEVELSTADGMPRPCAVNLDHVQTVSKARIGSRITRITTLSAARMEQVRRALAFALGFDAPARPIVAEAGAGIFTRGRRGPRRNR
jgi:mRNA interferase MazF